MTKSIKEVFELYEQHIRNHSRLSKGPELSLDQALKELEAIISQQVIGRDADTTNRDTKPMPPSVYHRLMGANYTKERQRLRLQEALYGKEE